MDTLKLFNRRFGSRHTLHSEVKMSQRFSIQSLSLGVQFSIRLLEVLDEIFKIYNVLH